MKPKKVELTELFFDLVFVFSISKMTALIHHLHHGIIDLFSIFTFAVCLIIVINTWITQTLFINRYGHNTYRDIICLLICMIPLLIMSNTFTTENWESVFSPYVTSVAFISIIPAFQYCFQYFKNNDKVDKNISLNFAIPLLLASSLFILSAIIPYKIGIILFFLVVPLSWLYPLFFSKNMNKKPVNFPHLIERMSLLIIITFGEMIIGVANYFTIDNFNINSIFIFLIIIFLFFIYITKFENIINHHSDKETGLRLIYLHYPIFLGLEFITVSFSFFNEEHVNHTFHILFLYLGIFLYLIFIYFHKLYNKKTHIYNNMFVISKFSILMVSFVICFIFKENSNIVIITTTIMSLLIALLYINFNKISLKNNNI